MYKKQQKYVVMVNAIIPRKFKLLHSKFVTKVSETVSVSCVKLKLASIHKFE